MGNEILIDIFFNDKFQWAAVATIVSFLGILVTFYSTWRINNKTIKANISSKTRIEWINQIRKLSADAITNINLLISVGKHSYGEQLNIAIQDGKIEKAFNIGMNTGIQDIGPQVQKKQSIESKRMYDEKYNDCVGAIYSSFNQLSLFFSDKEKDANLINSMDEIFTILSKLADYNRDEIKSNETQDYYQEKVNGHQQITDSLQLAVAVFKTEISEYLSSEWKKASSGK